MDKPRLLDLFCGAGGAGMGYYRAGFDVYGIDNHPQPHYPFPFLLMDAMEAMDRLLRGEGLTFSNGETLYLKDFCAFHASPPCQAYSVTRNYNREYPKLVNPIRQRLSDTGLPFDIENVMGSTLGLSCTIKLCGSAFGLGVRRHRLFESNIMMLNLGCKHHQQKEPLQITGRIGNSPRHRKPDTLEEAQIAMGINWMNWEELTQAIPPAYTEYVGKYLMQEIKQEVR